MFGIENYKVIGDFLKDYRSRSGLSQKVVADHLNLTSSQFISNIERGVAPVPMHLFVGMVELYKIPKTKVIDFVMKEQKKALKEIFKNTTKVV